MAAQVRHPCPRVVPVSLYSIPGPLHNALAGYKRSPSPDARLVHAAAVVCLLARFLFDHGQCLAGRGGWDFLTVVPSSSSSGLPHPLVQALDLVPWLADQHRRVLERGPGPMGAAMASDDGFVVEGVRRGERVVVIDDTFTSGGRSQSAASALSLAGARVLAVVPVGRVVDPRHDQVAACFWARLASQPFDFDRCRVEERRAALNGTGRAGISATGRAGLSGTGRCQPEGRQPW